jgi:hypothetical protein
MHDFLESLNTIMGATMEYGVRNVPIVPKGNESPFRDNRHQSNFMKACHRGYEKAQSTIFDFLQLLHADTRLPDAEKTYRELIYRRVIDAIAFCMLRTESHVVRRLSLHDRPPNLDFSTLISAKKAANSMNAESRLTFALLADLSTFIHVCDILRIDLRGKSPGVSLIELKSGHVNTFLLSHLESYEPKPESVERLRQDNKIDKRYLPQAERILRQKVRLTQINELLRYDKGIDINA